MIERTETMRVADRVLVEMKRDEHFFETEITKAMRHGITVILEDVPYVMVNDIQCAGFFDDQDLLLTGACGKPYEDWLPIFIHESSHMDQWIEKVPVWTDIVRILLPEHVEIGDPLTALDMWLKGEIELSEEIGTTYMKAARNIELDCERRTVEKIKRYGLQIDPEAYTQKANSYVYFYTYMMTSRQWYPDGKGPYVYPEIWTLCPKHFDNDYDTVPVELQQAYKEHLFKR